MKRLLELRDSDIFPNTQDVDSAGFQERRAVRAVVTNGLGQVALLWIENYNHHELPGGGVEEEDGSDLRRTLDREMREELGSEVEVTGKVGTIIEYEGRIKKLRISDCYLAEQIGEVVEPSFTQKEIADGQEVRWAENIDEAIAIIKADQPNDYVGQFIQVRELAFLRAAALLLRAESIS